MAKAESNAPSAGNDAVAAYERLATALPPEVALRETLAMHGEACAARRGIPPLEARWRLRALAPASLEVAATPPAGFDRVRAHAADVFVDRPDESLEPDALGDGYEALQRHTAREHRKRRGSYFTPAAVSRLAVSRVFDRWSPPRERPIVLDPAMGGGRFLLEARRQRPDALVHGMDVDPLAVWVARMTLLLSGDVDPSLEARLVVGDALERDLPRADVVVGNPPWVAFAGRQTVTLDEASRDRYRRLFHAFNGFPTLHGMFVERSADALVQGGRLMLLLPTQVSDLRGYGPTREALTARARLLAPLDEIGFGAFEGVVEPTLILLAERDADARPVASPWPVRERSGRRTAVPDTLAPLLGRLRALPSFPSETFGEAGFQTQKGLSTTNLGAWPGEPRFSVPMREGRDVEPFLAGRPRIALDPDPASLARAGARLRGAEQYARVKVVVRQTARYPIAAVHDPPHAFRNSLLACYTDEAEGMVALLNSTVLRAFHLASQRDGRQDVFPQLKVAHLRALPAPPGGIRSRGLVALSQRAAAAQRSRAEVSHALSAETGEAVPTSAFAPRSGSIPSRPELERRFGRAYDDALERARAHWTEFNDTLVAIDREVAAMYGVSEGELAALASIVNG